MVLARLRDIRLGQYAGLRSYKSDFDFVVALGEGDEDLVTRFVFFADDLETLLGRSVDLVFESKMKPRFRKTIAASRETVYESEDRPIAA